MTSQSPPVGTTAESSPNTNEVAKLLAAYDRPSAGSRCTRCGDWGTVVIRGRATQEEICPADGCAAAVRARLLRELR